MSTIAVECRLWIPESTTVAPQTLNSGKADCQVGWIVWETSWNLVGHIDLDGQVTELGLAVLAIFAVASACELRCHPTIISIQQAAYAQSTRHSSRTLNSKSSNIDSQYSDKRNQENTRKGLRKLQAFPTTLTLSSHHELKLDLCSPSQSSAGYPGDG